MTNRGFEAALHSCSDLARRHAAKRLQVADEFKRRYGTDPSDIDADEIIDSIDYGHGLITLAEVDRIMRKAQGERP